MPTTPSRAISSLRAICRLGLPAEQLLPALLEALHAVVPSYCNLFDWTDDNAKLVRYFFEGPVDAALAQLYFDEFHNQREAEAMAPFESLALLPGGVKGAQDLARGGFYESALYHEIWKPQGLHSRIEAVVRDRSGRLLGSLVLYRAPGDLPFTPADEHRLAHVLPDIAQAVSACGRAGVDEHWLPAPGLAETLLVDMQGRISHASSGAHGLLLRCEGGVSRDRLSRPLSELAQGVVTQLLTRLGRETGDSGRGRLPGPVRLQHSTTAGPLLVTGSWMMPLPPSVSLQPLGAARSAATGAAPGAAPLALLSLRPMEPQRVALERALLSLPLTPGQSSVCRELYHGASQAEVACRLGIGVSTVVDHVRKAYGALGLHSAAELRTLLDRRMF